MNHHRTRKKAFKHIQWNLNGFNLRHEFLLLLIKEKVRVNVFLSKQTILENVVPQGSVLSVTLFLVSFNEKI